MVSLDARHDNTLSIMSSHEIQLSARLINFFLICENVNFRANDDYYLLVSRFSSRSIYLMFVHCLIWTDWKKIYNFSQRFFHQDIIGSIRKWNKILWREEIIQTFWKNKRKEKPSQICWLWKFNHLQHYVRHDAFAVVIIYFTDLWL